ncbi:MAG: hypothetical protein QOE01_1943 [Actinomycetota bacterium]|jgi:hypothetical protein|nr:hypothetical protein [Actinomycetota bacterium]
MATIALGLVVFGAAALVNGSINWLIGRTRGPGGRYGWGFNLSQRHAATLAKAGACLLAVGLVLALALAVS